MLRIKNLKLAEITKPIDRDLKEKLMLKAVERILIPHNSTNKMLHQKIMTTLSTCFSTAVRDRILLFLLNDLRSYVDVALAWLFEEYSIMQVRFTVFFINKTNMFQISVKHINITL